VNTERTVPYLDQIDTNNSVEVVLSNPLNKENKISYHIDLFDNDFVKRWIVALRKNLEQDYHLEKNYCFLGWAKSSRDINYLCNEINKTFAQINEFNKSGEWQKHGLNDYTINDHFTRDLILDTKHTDGYEPFNHDPMNKLHRYFEDLQGEAWNISSYYQLADYETKWAIRQLNDLCHELESWALSYNKLNTQPEWQRPSQITTFLNAPRYDLQDNDYELFKKTRYDRDFGGVYLHWAQVGKTQFEVFRDEHGQDIDEATCSTINSLKFYSGEFDVEWGRDINEENHEWHRKEQEEFRAWLPRNGFDWGDSKLSLGYIKIGQVNTQKSFGTEDFFEIIDKMSNYLNIDEIKVKEKDSLTSRKFPYVWSDTNYKQMQIDFLKPGYDWSKRQYVK
jgi:hypothetical protein